MGRDIQGGVGEDVQGGRMGTCACKSYSSINAIFSIHINNAFKCEANSII